MKKFKLFVGLCVFMALSLFITGIYGYFKMTTSPAVNTLSVKDKTTYTVVHKTMNIDGTTYSDYFTENYEVTLGTTVTPATLTSAQLPGFTAPATQTVTLNSFQNTVITYLYTRNQYDLIITNPQHVNASTSTPAGRYYYGTAIHLEADADDGNGNNFIKWSNNNTNRIYEFTLEEDTTIGPIYTDTYQVTYVLNNGDPNETRVVNNDEPINYLPNVSYNDCTGSTGDRIADGCTYDYELVGWYTEPTFENQVNEQYAPDHDVTLYARWNKVFFYQEDSEIFNADHLIDSDIALFSAFNSGKDFIVEFRIDSFANDNVDRAVLFADMEETADPYPGVQFRWFQNSFNVNANGNDKNHKKNTAVTVSPGAKIILKKENGLFSYSLDNGVTFVNYQDYSNFNKFFDITATFGGQVVKPERALKGALSEMRVELIDRPAYTIKFHANGGTGMMLDQVVEVGKTVNLNDKEYEKDPVHYTFAGWNTEPDGSGTSYTNKQQITDIANDGDVVDLYAQWEKIRYYYLHFDANGSSGTMTDQEILFNEETTIKPLEFTKTGYGFFGWNTESDGSGTWYEDEDTILNLASNDDEVITLYAIFLKTEFEQAGDHVFDGTVNTFIDTGVNLYSDNTTMNKDFEIRFTVTSVADTVISVYTQATILNCKDESNNKWPGFNVRFESNSRTNMIPQYKWNNAGSSTKLPAISTNKVPVEMIFKRRDGIVYFSYTDKDGNGTTTELYNQGSWILNQYFADNCSFGGIYNSSHQPDRFFTGTISDMRIIVEE